MDIQSILICVCKFAMHKRKGPQSCILEGPWAGNNAVPCAYFTCIAYERLKISNDNKNRSGYCKRIHKPKFRPFPFVWRPPLRQKAQEVTQCFLMKRFSLVLCHFCKVSLTKPYLQWGRLRSSWFAPNRIRLKTVRKSSHGNLTKFLNAPLEVTDLPYSRCTYLY